MVEVLKEHLPIPHKADLPFSITCANVIHGESCLEISKLTPFSTPTDCHRKNNLFNQSSSQSTTCSIGRYKIPIVYKASESLFSFESRSQKDVHFPAFKPNCSRNGKTSNNLLIE